MRAGAAAALLVIFAPLGLEAGLLEGRWRLVEERYGEGRSNLVRPESAQRLEFASEGGRLAGRIWIEDGPREGLPWPAFAAEGRALPLRAVEVTISPGDGGVRARYRVSPSPDDPTEIEVVEDYRVQEDGRSLAGTVTVSLIRDGEDRGSFVLHRRFERQR